MVLELSEGADISDGGDGKIKTLAAPALSLLKRKEQGIQANPGKCPEGS